MKRVKNTLLFCLIFVLLTSGCTRFSGASAGENVYIDQVELTEVAVEEEAAVLADRPAAVSELLLPVASGTAEKKTGDVTIDYSNTADGYVMVRYSAANEKKMMVQVAGPNTTYTYVLPASQWVTFPLSDGNGSYKITALENTRDSKYAVLASVSTTVTLKDEFAPFLRPNQYVNYANAEKTLQKARELTESTDDTLKKVEYIYNYVVTTISYDDDKAKTVKSGYLPVLDDVLKTQKGICFDYAALMAGMLRSQGVPCKLVVGYAGSVYHAWINVWTEETGWLDGAIYFNGSGWQRMDPTFASSGQGNEAVLKYIGDGNNYMPKYLY